MYYQVKAEVNSKLGVILTHLFEIEPPMCPCCNVYCELDRAQLAMEYFKEANPLFEDPKIVATVEPNKFASYYTISDTHEYIDRTSDEIVEDRIVQVVSITVHVRLTI